MVSRQHGPNVQLQQTSRLREPLESFGKPQEEKPVDITQSMHQMSVDTKNVLPKKHESHELGKEVKNYIFVLLAEGTAIIQRISQ